MHGLTIVKSLLVRVFLVTHGLICAWRVVDTSDNQYCWVILVGLGFLLVETGIVIWLRNGREFKTVSFCIIFYLACSIPSLWIIHVETANRKLYHLAENKLNSRAASWPSHLRAQHTPNKTALQMGQLPTTAPPFMISIGPVECHDKAWYYMDEQRWLDAIQETMLIVIGICRLLISREHMTVENSGIVLILTMVNGADLLAMSHSLQYHDIIVDRLWMYIGLILLSIGLLQMSSIDTDGLTPPSNRKRSNKANKKKLLQKIHFLQDQNLCPLFRSLFIHDGLILVYRTLLAAKVRCSKPTIIFYMAKNVLMISLHCYRVYEAAKERDRKKAFVAYENLIHSTKYPKKHRYPYHGYERDHLQKQEQQLLHRTLRRPPSISHRRKQKTSRTLYTFPHNSISYPFSRRRNDGGRARTAFALYGLPFHTPVAPRPATISSTSSLVAKALVH